MVGGGKHVARPKRGSPDPFVITGPTGSSGKLYFWWCYSTDWPLTTSPTFPNLLILCIERLGPLYAFLKAGVKEEPTP